MGMPVFHDPVLKQTNRNQVDPAEFIDMSFIVRYWFPSNVSLLLQMPFTEHRVELLFREL